MSRGTVRRRRRLRKAPGIGERLDRAIGLAGISKDELDRLAGKTRGHARAIIDSEGADILTDTAVRYANALGLDLLWLIVGHGTEPTHESTAAAVEIARRARATTLRAA